MLRAYYLLPVSQKFSKVRNLLARVGAPERSLFRLLNYKIRVCWWNVEHQLRRLCVTDVFIPTHLSIPSPRETTAVLHSLSSRAWM